MSMADHGCSTAPFVVDFAPPAIVGHAQITIDRAKTASVRVFLSILGRIIIHGSSHCSILKASSKSTLTCFDPPFIETFSSHHDPTMSDKSQVSAEAAGGEVKPLVGFLGPQASYTHQVDIFEVVQAGEVAFGVVPVENSTNGSVLFTLDNFADRNGLYPDISVCGEIYLDVHHFLVGRRPDPVHDAAAGPGLRGGDEGSGACTPTASDPNPLKPRTKPLCSLKHVRRLYSHPQAWGQCVAFLQTYLKGIEAIDVSSTSRAAELVSLDETGTSAAISSEIAAGMHGIDVLARTIEDREDNTTRFFIIRKGLDEKQKMPGHCVKPKTKTKSMVSFTVPHEAPGALADVLECFRRYGTNLTSINSRPSLTAPFNYVFFVEFEGHRFRDPEARVKGALDGVARVAERWRWLGSWEDQRS
ncbi:prephenate dehydratase [Colletotrichum tamarilloi]|uniref:Prephenate dehydratase n=1 Tax=Colletotrichum tamarilloi TaxID=1209934 RepID=A0ABQ9RPH2_9PEZI|nr:prephenate dehydratase [Colletotrichum tamarilloi]KAK1509626.1 prephenate dehydratase [Colletotrichum tamarilloi]